MRLTSICVDGFMLCLYLVAILTGNYLHTIREYIGMDDTIMAKLIY